MDAEREKERQEIRRQGWSRRDKNKTRGRDVEGEARDQEAGREQ